MAKIEVNEHEAQLIAVFRAIREFDNPLVNVGEVGDVLNGINAIVGEEKFANLNAQERKALLYGFVAGIAAMKLAQEPAMPSYLDQDDSEETYFTGGPSGGVAVGQGEDPRYVHQTGPREDQEVESKQSS